MHECNRDKMQGCVNGAISYLEEALELLDIYYDGNPEKVDVEVGAAFGTINAAINALRAVSAE